MASKTRLSPEMRAYIFMNKDYLSVTNLARECGVSRMHIYRIWKEGLERKSKCGKSPGAPRKIDQRSERRLIRLIPVLRGINGNWRSTQLMKVGEFEHLHRSTMTRCLNRNGYKLLNARKKGLLSAKDRTARVRFARKMLKRDDIGTYWISGISFYLDAVSFIYKSNPREYAAAPTGQCWRKPEEGLQHTGKGSACGTGGKYVRVIACISHGKGVVWASTYEKMCGATFASFVRCHFNKIFKKCGKKSRNVHIWLQDGDRSQNSAAARNAMDEVMANRIQKIPPRSPDLNPIENVFHVVKKQLKEEAIALNIETESKKEYEKRVLTALRNYPTHLIDKTIESMEGRLRLIKNGKGHRLKY